MAATLLISRYKKEKEQEVCNMREIKHFITQAHSLRYLSAIGQAPLIA
jgi:hypothetical protein